MKVDIYTVVKNQEHLAKFFYEYYRNVFPGCKFHIYDNHSTDDTRKVFQGSDCWIYDYPVDSDKKYNEEDKTLFYNNVWKNSKADWVIVCDIDEILQITPNDLHAWDVIKFRGYQMISMDDKYDYNPAVLTHGFPMPLYDKTNIFRPSIEEIGYTLGSHTANPKPNNLRVSDREFKLLHYNEAFVATCTPKPFRVQGSITFDHKAYHKECCKQAIKVT